jgi:hypothetical protein
MMFFIFPLAHFITIKLKIIFAFNISNDFL